MLFGSARLVALTESLTLYTVSLTLASPYPMDRYADTIPAYLTQRPALLRQTCHRFRLPKIGSNAGLA